MKKRNFLIKAIFILLLLSSLINNGCSSLPPLHSAAEKNDISKANKIILSNKTDINSITKYGQTALHCAARNGNLEMVKLLYQAGGDLDKTTAYSWTPLIEAAHYGQYDVAEWLVNQECNVNIKTNKGVSALFMACCYKYDRIVEILIPRSRSILNDMTDSGFTSLHAACEETYEETPLAKQKPELKITKEEYLQKQKRIVEALLAAKIDVNIQTDFGTTALHHAINNLASPTILKSLLSNGASLQKRDNSGYLPIHTAAKKGDTPIFECLIQNKAIIEPMEASNEITGRTYHMYANYLEKGSTPEQSQQYYTMAIHEYEVEIEKNKAMAASLGKKIFNLRLKKFAADLAMAALAAAASSQSNTYNYYYIPGHLNLSSLKQRKKNCEETVSRCEKWLEECKSKKI
jgi:ankyrin repeat protein